MRLSEAVIENGRIVETNVKIINQSDLTSECWGIQMWGIEKCDTCEFLNTDECGGQEIRKRILNENV